MPIHNSGITVFANRVDREQVLHQENFVPAFPRYALRQ